MKSFFQTILVALTLITFVGCAQKAKDREMQKELQTFIDAHLEMVRSMEKEAALVAWAAETTGKPEHYDKLSELELAIRKIYSNPMEFAYLKKMKESQSIKDPLLARQLTLLHDEYLSNQIPPELLKEIVDLGNDIAKKFNVFRGTIKGKKVTANEIKEILKSETDSEKRKDAWLASKQVGPEVADDIIRLVKLRNRAARELGFENYHTMSLTLSEQDPKELNRIFKQLDSLTAEPFRNLKADLDRVLADNVNIPVSQLQPWHYHDPFFQDTPMVYDLDLDTYYKGKDVVKLSTQFYKGIGLPVESVLARSDLYEREGKNPHAFCTDIDREGDVRILCNIKDNEGWMETILHELGHAVYDLNQDPETPFLLRHPAHIFTTEAMAMFFGRLSRNPYWMQEMLGLSDAQRREIETVGDRYARLKQLIFARWAMVMYEFEKNLYADPDQDLDALWWRTVEKYQFVKKPKGRAAPDWAAKIHIATAPCYYHNYLMGELFASQLHHYLVANVLKEDSDAEVNYCGQKKVGKYLTKNIFEPGAIYKWDTMIERATGEPLTPKYFVEQFVK